MHSLLFMPTCLLLIYFLSHIQTMPGTIFTKITLSSLDFQQLRLRFINFKAEVIIVQTLKVRTFHILVFLFSERKRGRQTYTRYQTLELEKEFHFNRKVTGPAFTSLLQLSLAFSCILYGFLQTFSSSCLYIISNLTMTWKGEIFVLLSTLNEIR